jgi:hypothetical protein
MKFVIQSSLPPDDELATKRKLMDQENPGWRDMRHANGALMFAPTGTMLDDKGNRSIFDDLCD